MFNYQQINSQINVCNAWRERERERLFDIWFVFRIWEFVVNYGDFICLTCVLYVGLVENFNLQLGYNFG